MLREKNDEDVGNAKGLLINTYDPVTCVISGITYVELFLMDTPGLYIMDLLLCPDWLSINTAHYNPLNLSWYETLMHSGESSHSFPLNNYCKFYVTLFSANVFPSAIRGKTVWGVHSFSLNIRDDFQNSVDLFLPIFLMDCLLLWVVSMGSCSQEMILWEVAWSRGPLMAVELCLVNPCYLQPGSFQG